MKIKSVEIITASKGKKSKKVVRCHDCGGAIGDELILKFFTPKPPVCCACFESSIERAIVKNIRNMVGTLRKTKKKPRSKSK